MAARDLLEAALERVDLERRLVVDLPQRRLAEVCDLGAGKAADEALRAGDPDLDVADLENDVAPVEHDDARRPRDGRDLVAAARVVVVVSEHGDDRDLDRPAGVREHRGLLGQAVRRQVAGEQDEIRLLRDRPRTHARGALEAARRHGCRLPLRREWLLSQNSCTRSGRSANAETGTTTRL